MRALAPLLLALGLAACGRPLAPAEADFAARLHGPSLDTSTVRIAAGIPFVPARTYPVRPRVTCQDRIFPPAPGPTIRGRPPGITLFHQIRLQRRLHGPDLIAGYPETLPLARAMLLAHELTHVWQWQNRALTGYHPLKAAAEHVRTDDPYLFDPDTEARFLDLGYEQQGALVEEYVCCRALDPEGARTARLHAMLSEVFPLSRLDLPLAQSLALPWAGAEVAGICT